MTLLQWTLTYARRGWPVFPCNPRSKRPLPKGAVDIDGNEIPKSGGVKKATTDEAIITAWWTQWPKAMIGLACGPECGMFVLDGDAGTDKDTGEVFELPAIVSRLESLLGEPLPQTWCVATPRGGMHWYFRQPAGVPLGNAKGALDALKRFDVRGAGGYVILPPSTNAEGKGYAWVRKPAAKDDEPAAAPAVLIDCIREQGRFAPQPAPAAPARPFVRSSGPPVRGSPHSTKAPGGAAAADVREAGDDALARYARKAFELEVTEVRNAGRGGRNQRLNLAALRLAELVHVGEFSAEDVRAELIKAADACGLVKEDGRKPCLATIESGLRDGLRKPRDLTEIRLQAEERARRYATAGPRAPEPPPFAPPEDQATLPKREATQGDARRRARPAANVGQGNGRQPPRRPPDHDEDDGARAWHLNAKLSRFPMTDLGNVERYVERWRGRLLWCPAVGWLAWDGCRWNPEGAEGRAREAEHLTIRAIQDEAAWLAASHEDIIVAERKAPRKAKRKGTADGGGDAGEEPAGEVVMMSDLLARFGRASESRPRMRLADDAKPYLEVMARQLDADPLKINVANGTITIVRKGVVAEIQFGPHNPDDLITKRAHVEYDDDARCPEYDGFLELVQPNDEMRRFLHQWGGYSLTGDTSEQVFTFNHGKGKNGKTTLFNAWARVAGDYGRSVQIETFLEQAHARSGGQATPDLAMLKAVRYLRTSEPEKGAKLAEALIKLATGGEPMNVRHLNKEFFELQPEFKLSMAGNYKPIIVGTDEGIWRRVRLIPWDVMIPVEKRVKDFDRLKLYPEASGILNRLLAGIVDWLEHGLIEPAEVVKATAEYRSDSDPLGRFLSACVLLEENARVQASVLHDLFIAWARANAETGQREWSATGFGRAMRERGFRSKHSDVNFWLGLRAIKSRSDFVDQDGRPHKPRGAADGGGESGGLPNDEVPA